MKDRGKPSEVIGSMGHSEHLVVAPREIIEARKHSENVKTAVILRDLAFCIESMARAMEEGDDILGCIAGQGIANHLPALPKHVRDVFMEYLDDEAAAALVAERRYYEEMAR